MGGNATKQFGTGRLDKPSYKMIARFFSFLLGKHLPAPHKSCVIESYADKDSFGDLDLLATENLSSLVHLNTFDTLLARHDQQFFRVHGSVMNGSVCSYAVSLNLPAIWAALDSGLAADEVAALEIAESGWTQPFQVDYIHVDCDSYDFARQYFAFNDLGNYIGRIASGCGFKFGFNGLFKRMYFNECGHEVQVRNLKSQQQRLAESALRQDACRRQDVLVTRDFGRAVEFLGFDYPRYLQGFQTLEDIFWYVARSRYFHLDNFRLDNRKSNVRARDLKRSNYNLMLDFFEKNLHGAAEEPVYPDMDRLYRMFPQAKRDLQEAAGKALRDAQMDKLLGKRLVFSVMRNEFDIDFFSKTRDGRVLNISEKVIHGRDEIIASAACEEMPEWNGRRLWPVSKGQEILDKLKAGVAWRAMPGISRTKTPCIPGLRTNCGN